MLGEFIASHILYIITYIVNSTRRARHIELEYMLSII